MQPSSRNEQLAVVLLHCCPGGPSSDRDGLLVPPPVTHAAESLPRQFCGGLHIDHDAGHALTVGRRHALTVRANSTVAAADNRSTGVLTATPLLYSTPPRGKIATAGGAVKTFSTYIKSRALRAAAPRPSSGAPWHSDQETVRATLICRERSLAGCRSARS